MHSSGLPQSAARRDVPGYALRARCGAAHCRGGLRGRSPHARRIVETLKSL